MPPDREESTFYVGDFVVKHNRLKTIEITKQIGNWLIGYFTMVNGDVYPAKWTLDGECATTPKIDLKKLWYKNIPVNGLLCFQHGFSVPVLVNQFVPDGRTVKAKVRVSETEEKTIELSVDLLTPCTSDIIKRYLFKGIN